MWKDSLCVLYSCTQLNIFTLCFCVSWSIIFLRHVMYFFVPRLYFFCTPNLLVLLYLLLSIFLTLYRILDSALRVRILPSFPTTVKLWDFLLKKGDISEHMLWFHRQKLKNEVLKFICCTLSAGPLSTRNQCWVSMTFWYGSGSVSRSCYFRQSPSRWQQNILFSLIFLFITFWSYTFTSFFKDKKS